MGIVNTTPDSFSDGGLFLDYGDAFAQVERLASEGADIIDIGGESTRPGAVRPSLDEEMARTIPVIRSAKESPELGNIELSIDTMRSEVARAAIAAGVNYVNDVSGGKADPKILKVMAENPQVQYILMHWRAHSSEAGAHANYQDVVREVKAELEAAIENAMAAGVSAEQIIIDPGIGFSKDAVHNWDLLAGLPRLELLGFPILIGASRKRFLGELLNRVSATDRDDASVALTAILASSGIWGVRTHTVRAHKDAIAVAHRLLGAADAI
jgi:dihydropteroate synthase